MSQHKCAVKSCRVKVNTNQVLCLAHWRKLSPQQQSSYFRAHAAHTRGHLGDLAFGNVVAECAAQAIERKKVPLRMNITEPMVNYMLDRLAPKAP